LRGGVFYEKDKIFHKKIKKIVCRIKKALFRRKEVNQKSWSWKIRRRWINICTF